MAFIKHVLFALAVALSFAAPTPAEWPAAFLPGMALQAGPVQFRTVGGSYLGLRLNDIDADRAKVLRLNELSGVEVVGVQEGAAADQAGVKLSDVILSYNGEKILGVQQFVRLVSETPPGRAVRLICSREGAQKNMLVTTGARHIIQADDELDLPRMQITDVPSPLMLWRNLVLGMESEALNDQLAQFFGVKQGILIWSVVPAYPAQRAGLRAGDVVTAFCGHSVHSPRELGIAMQQLQTGQKPIYVELVRDHKVVSLSIALDGER